MLDVCLEFSGEFLFVILLKLFLDDSNYRGNAVILTLSQQAIHFFIGIVTGIEVDEALKGSVLLVVLELLLNNVFLSVVCDLLKHI